MNWGGSSSGEVKEYYYRINIQGLFDGVGEESAEVIALLMQASYVIIPYNKKYREMYITDILLSFNDVDFLKNIIAFRCVDNIPITTTISDNMYYIYGNNTTKVKNLCITMSGYIPNEVLELMNSNIIEISKQEYEALIEIPSIILGKE